jgi:hypothetical protein
MTAIGNDRDLNLRIHRFDPGQDRREIAAIDRVTIVAAECELAYVSYSFSTYALLEKFQRKLPIQKSIGHFGPGASGTAQSTDAAELNVPVIPGQLHANSTSVL